METAQARVLVLSRCALAFSALAIALADPSGPAQLVKWTYAATASYCLYSAVLATISYGVGWPAPHRGLHWFDVLFFSYLIALTGGPTSFYVVFFFHSILVASFSSGFREGILVTLASLVLFVFVSLIVNSTPNQSEFGHLLLGAASLSIFGYIISYLGGYERLLRGRLALLKEINSFWNPRFGVNHAYGVNLDRLLEFYGGSSCVLLLRRPTEALDYAMYSAFPDKPGHSTMPSNVTENVAGALLSLPETLAAYYHDPTSSPWRRLRGYYAYDFDLKVDTKAFSRECAAFANMLDTQAFVTVPYIQRDGVAGRIFLTTDRSGFSDTDIGFLAQVADAMATVGENMSLIEELISKAAEHERLNISRDLHDTTIQPYIGLKLALDALYREAGANNAVSPRIAELINMAELTVRDLRDYATRLKNKTAMPGEYLVAAVKKQTERLGRFYGINVEVTSDISPRLNERLAAEAYQIVSEGLSNVLRHTSAKSASVTILCEDSQLLLQVSNDAGSDERGAKKFMPRSIYERVQMLGGKTFIERRPDNGHTVIYVSIPM